MRVVRFTGGPLETRGYLVADDASRAAIQVDAPAGVAPAVAAELRRGGLTLVALVNTHGPWDHIGDNVAIREATGTPLLAHRGDADLLRAPHAFGFPLERPIPPSEPDRWIEEGDVIEAGSLRFRVLHTPGHSPGGVCLYEPAHEVLFSGDTLFDGSYGRTDLPGASERRMWESLIRLAALPPATRVWPGHGEPTTIGAQPWLTALAR
jgi:hydroxyacylglutathione hydrolase